VRVEHSRAFVSWTRKGSTPRVMPHRGIVEPASTQCPVTWFTLANVCYRPLADIPSCAAPVRFRGKSRHRSRIAKCPLMTQSGGRFAQNLENSILMLIRATGCFVLLSITQKMRAPRFVITPEEVADALNQPTFD